MTQKSIAFKGIQRALPGSNSVDGACQELINMRFRKGCWRPIPQKTYYFVNGEGESPQLTLSYNDIYFHDVEDGINSGMPNMIGLKQVDNIDDPNDTIFSLKLYLINPKIGSGVEITTGLGLMNDYAVLSVPTIVFLKRTMLVTTSEGVKNFLWINGAYEQLASLPVPDVNLTTFDSDTTPYQDVILRYHDASAVLGDFYKMINTQSESNGRLYGSIMYVSAYRMFDGSYILPSIPKYLEINNGGKVWHDSMDSNPDVYWFADFTCSKVQATIDNTLYPASIGSIKDLIESVCIFATKVTPLHLIDDTTLTETLLASYGSNESSREFKTLFPISSDFKKLAESSGWYKVLEFNFEDVVGKSGKQTKPIESEGFYQDYATRETLPADQNTHHSLIAKSAYVYNDRLHLLNIKNKFGLPYVYWPELTNQVMYRTDTGQIIVYLKTSSGQSIITSDVSIKVYRESTLVQGDDYATEQEAMTAISLLLGTVPDYAGDGYYTLIQTDLGVWVYRVFYSVYSGAADEKYVLPAIVGYNDARAYRIQIVADDKLIFDNSLTKNSLMNFSTWVNPTFNVNEDMAEVNYAPDIRLVSEFAMLSDFVDVDEVSPLFDPNRLQVSEIQNPIVFPAKNSYQIGTGEGLTMAAGSEPLSSGQFGQFPLQVFTTKGIWGMEVGTGEVLYTNILPINSEVINNVRNVVPISTGVVYSTDRGLYVIQGMKVTELSEIIENDNWGNFPNISEITGIVTDAADNESALLKSPLLVSGLSNALSTVDFLQYLTGSTVGYDHVNKELVVTNSGYAYSYIYSFESQAWSKISTSYSLLINAYPKLLGVKSGNIYDISVENTNVYTECLIISQPQSFEQADMFKRIDRAILRCLTSTEVSKYAGLYLFASDDLITWQLITGKQKQGLKNKDLMIQRSHCSAKYYLFVFAGKIHSQDEIKQIDLVWFERMANKLR